LDAGERPSFESETVAASIVQIAPVSAPQWTEALQLLYGYLPEPQRRQQVSAMRAADAALKQPAGMFAAYRDGQMAGVVQARVQPGCCAEFALPQLTPGEAASTTHLLMQAAEDWMRQQNVRMAQIMLADPPPSQIALLSAWGFAYVGDLLYLMCGADKFPGEPPASSLEFEAYSSANHGRLARVVTQTYEQTRDCPGLNGVRQVDDVLASYQATGIFDPQRWLIARYQQEDIGCLLLADFPQHDNYELVYMGVAPAHRGRRWGVEIVRYAQWRTRQAGRSWLVLAVDAANQPAIDMYAAAGFQTWECRQAYVKVFQ
jgi:mycothiol synthase